MQRAMRELHERERKISVTEREFLWVQDDDKGEVTLHVGPCMVSPTAADRVVIDDGNGGFKRDNRGNGLGIPQRMIEANDGQYVVLHNPIEALGGDENTQNGRFVKGRNDPRTLRNGTRQMIPGPCSFYLRPGQRAEVREAHKLGSNQYVVVEVYGEVDETAPFFDVTLSSAFRDHSNLPTPSGEDAPSTPPRKLTRGQQVVIRGIDTQFYIPPTGVDVVPDVSVDDSGTTISGDQAKQILSQVLSQQDDHEDEDDDYLESMSGTALAVATPDGAKLYTSSNVSMDTSYSSTVSAVGPEGSTGQEGPEEDESGRHHRSSVRSGDTPAYKALKELAWGGRSRKRAAVDYAPERRSLHSNVANMPQVRAEVERRAASARLVRDAVVLSEKEFCVIIDADGRRNVHRGPDRVFPGPYDTFLTEGSRNRVYDAYELLPHRALWIRVLTEIDSTALLGRLPKGAELSKDSYSPGDEILLSGINAFFFPFNEIEVLSPITGQAVVGNNHEDIVIEAIGIDQKSGIYVRDLTTGEARLVRGKQSYLVNPAKEIHISRTVSAEDWNHWILANRPHKTQMHKSVTTPWALSIRIPNNMAILATSADGQRVIEGPQVELLEYEEKLSYLELSTGTPKSTKGKVRTCFLRTSGNRVTDVVRIQTSDFVEIDIAVSFHVNFRQEFKEKWFNYKNYVQVMCDHVRSLLRGHCRGITLADLWPKLAETFRNVVLGTKGENGARPGRAFDENGMIITEVEVLNSKILDQQIASQFEEAQREIVSLQIGDRQAQARLASAKYRAGVEREENELEQTNAKLKSELESLVRELSQQASEARLTNDRQLKLQSLMTETEVADKQQQAELERLRRTTESENELILTSAEARKQADELKNQVILDLERNRAEIEKNLVAAKASAKATENQSVTPGLVEAITALGDKQVLAEAANNMNLVSLFKGKDVGELFKSLFGGTRLGQTAERLAERLTTASE